MIAIAASIIVATTSTSAKELSDTSMRWQTGFLSTVSNGDYAPFYMASNRHGLVSSGKNTLIWGNVAREMDNSSHFDYAFGLTLFGGYTYSIDYRRFDMAQGWTKHSLHPSRVWLQEIYGDIKWRGLRLNIGMKNRGSNFVDNNLSGGDLIHSGNARPVPQARISFNGWQPVPLTKGWLEVDGDFAYGKFADSEWWEHHSNHYNGHIASGVWYVYRRLIFRSDNKQAFGVMFGAQAAGQFGGKTVYRKNGEIVLVNDRGVELSDFIKMIIPHETGDEGFYMGNTIGSWDIKCRYRFVDGIELSAYVQFPWEDGSGIGKLNGWDGLYGLEMKLSDKNCVINGVVIEWLDLMNQSGPMHFAPGDYEGTTILSEATGADDYYNNTTYNSYANYGMILGSPMVMSPIYNRDGWMGVVGNRMRAFHFGAEGRLSSTVNWRLKCGWRRAYGSGFVPLAHSVDGKSAMIKIDWQPAKLRGVKIGAELAVDRGDMPCNAFGCGLSVSYSGLMSLR